MTMILANAVAMIGCVLMVLVGFLRKKEQILTVQCFQFGFLAMGNIILGGVTGFVCGVVSIIRNIVFAKNGGTKKLKLLFIAIQTTVTLLIALLDWLGWLDRLGLVGWNGWLDCLPLISGILLTWFIDLKKELHFKIVLIVTQVTWLIFDWNYKIYTSFVFDIFTIVSNLVGIWMILKNAKKEKAPLV